MIQTTTDLVRKTVDRAGIEKVRKALYSDQEKEYIAMSYWINSRMDWCKKEMVTALENLNKQGNK